MKIRSQIFWAFLVFAGSLLCLEHIQRIRHPYVGFRNMTNSLGFRGPEFDPRKAAGIFRILFIGGSTTYGVSGPAEDAFPHLTGRLLNRHDLSKKIEVINAAQPGRNSYWLSPRLQETLNLDPDLVIAMIGENDCAAVYQEFVDITQRGDLKKFPWYEKLSAWLASRSVLYVTLREKLSLSIHGKPDFAFGGPPGPTKERMPKDPAWFRYYPGYFEENIEKSIQIANAHRIRMVFIQPPLSQKRRSQKPAYAKAYDLLMIRLRHVTARHGVPLIRLDHFYENLESSFPPDWDGLHLPPEAERKMAHEIAHYLLENGLLL